MDEMDVSEPFEWKVEPLDGVEDMAVLVQKFQAPVAEVPRSLNWLANS
jgi:hypothetical protein